MKREELMIGDWILCYDNIKPCKVLAISDEGVNVCGFFEKVPFGLAKPIPVTSEILEKNGLKHLNTNGFYIKFKEEDSLIVIHYDNLYLDIAKTNSFSKIFIPCMYVHELQHALRLCKIDKEIEL